VDFDGTYRNLPIFRFWVTTVKEALNETKRAMNGMSFYIILLAGHYFCLVLHVTMTQPDQVALSDRPTRSTAAGSARSHCRDARRHLFEKTDTTPARTVSQVDLAVWLDEYLEIGSTPRRPARSKL
jgi:hypothetical protein